MEACIVIAQLVGLLNSQPIDVYKLDCLTTTRYISLDDNTMLELKIDGINKDSTYNVTVMDRHEIATKK